MSNALFSVLRSCKPIFEVLKGWKADTSSVTRFEDLPPAACNYVERIEKLVGCEVGIISTSPLREQTIIRPESRIAHWLPPR